MATELLDSIREEIAHVEAEIEAEKKAAKNCATEEERWNATVKLRELHTRLAELERNLKSAE